VIKLHLTTPGKRKYDPPIKGCSCPFYIDPLTIIEVYRSQVKTIAYCRGRTIHYAARPRANTTTIRYGRGVNDFHNVVESPEEVLKLLGWQNATF